MDQKEKEEIGNPVEYIGDLEDRYSNSPLVVDTVFGRMWDPSWDFDRFHNLGHPALLTQFGSIADFVGFVLDSPHKSATCLHNQQIVDSAENPDLYSNKNCHVSMVRADLDSSRGQFGNTAHRHLHSRGAVVPAACSKTGVDLTSQPGSRADTSMEQFVLT